MKNKKLMNEVVRNVQGRARRVVLERAVRKFIKAEETWYKHERFKVYRELTAALEIPLDVGHDDASTNPDDWSVERQLAYQIDRATFYAMEVNGLMNEAHAMRRVLKHIAEHCIEHPELAQLALRAAEQPPTAAVPLDAEEE